VCSSGWSHVQGSLSKGDVFFGGCEVAGIIDILSLPTKIHLVWSSAWSHVQGSLSKGVVFFGECEVAGIIDILSSPTKIRLA
jgi:hypothetical protein